jgi:hypothetical protein
LHFEVESTLENEVKNILLLKK